ncbi:MAG: hypothetical protein LBM26_03275 [Methanobrevibacter sp.]|jgi:hypothetical protein|nr:hypothetical protein [Methanobrevibacter sp.]
MINNEKVKEIANSYNTEPEHETGNPEKLDNGNWYVPFLNKDGKIVSGLEIDVKTGKNLSLV